MKVIFINRYFHPDLSATSQLLTDLATFLSGREFELHVITSRQLYEDPAADLPPGGKFRGVHVHRAWTSRFGRQNLLGRAIDYATFYLNSASLLFRLASRGSVVVAKTDPPLLSLVAAPICAIRGARLVNWLQDIFPEIADALGIQASRGVVGRFIVWLRDKTLRFARMNVVLGEEMKRYLGGRGIPRVRVIPNWADGGSITPVEPAANSLRSEWGLNEKVVVGYSGNMGRVHEFETILQAAHELKGRSDIVFLFIGSGPRRPWIEERVKELGLANVLFRPYQPRGMLGQSLSVPDIHLASLIPGLESYVFPSKLYGILAAGRPVLYVGRTDGEIPALISEAQIGMAVQAGDGKGLARKITRLASDRSERAAMGVRARRLYDERYSSEQSLRQWEMLLEEIGRETVQ